MKVAPLFSLLSRLLARRWALRLLRTITPRRREPMTPTPPRRDHPARLVLIVSIAATVLGEVLFRCDAPLHPLVAVFLRQANLAVICATPPVLLPGGVPAVPELAPVLPAAPDLGPGG